MSRPITVAIDEYAEKALGNREYFLNSPIAVVVTGSIKSRDCSGFKITE